MATGKVKEYDGVKGLVTYNGQDYSFRYSDIAVKGNVFLNKDQNVTFEIKGNKAQKVKPDNSLRQGGI